MPRAKQTLHASGLVEVKATVGKTLDNKRIQKSFYGTSKLDAKRKADNYILQQEIAQATGDTFIKKEYTFGEWANKWLETKKGTVKKSTYDTTYKSKLDKYITPYFSKSQLTNVRQIDVQNFFNKHSNLSKSTLTKLKIILKAIFDLAIDNDLCYKNPVKNVKFADNTTVSRNVYTAVQRDKLVKHCIANNELDILLLIKTGIRRSELLGLMWSDIDFSQATIHIQRAVTPDSSGAVVDKTKTKTSDRIIPIDNELNTVLMSQQATGYVFGGHSYIDPSNYGKRFKAKIYVHNDIDVLKKALNLIV